MAPNTKPIRVLTTGTAATGFAERALHYAADLLLIGPADTWRAALDRRNELRPDVLIVEAGPDTLDTVAAIESFAEHAPGIGVVVLDAGISLASLRRGMLAGAAGYFGLPPDAAELVLALRRAGRGAVALPDARERGSSITAVWSPKGGAGCSTLSANLAIALGRDAATIVVDGDPHGDLELLLNLESGSTLADLFAADLDANAINNAAVPHPSGIRALLAPPEELGRHEIDAQRLRAVLQALRGSFAHVVVDAGTTLDDRVFAIMDAADRIVVLTTPEPAAFRRLIRFLELATALGLEHKLLLLLNRYDHELAARLDGIERTIGRPFDYIIGDARREMVIAAVDGVPLVMHRPEHPVARNIAALALALTLRRSAD